jgi:hypothetical protein
MVVKTLNTHQNSPLPSSHCPLENLARRVLVAVAEQVVADKAWFIMAAKESFFVSTLPVNAAFIFT